MNILVVFASNSGSVLQIAEKLALQLKKKHRVVVQRAEEVKASDFLQYDGIILGTPSWSVDGHEGWPLPAMLRLLREMDGKRFAKQWFALFGCGDNSYTFFCGAVDYMEGVLAKVAGKKMIDSLRIDSYYFDLQKNIAQVEEWGKGLEETLRRSK